MIVTLARKSLRAHLGPQHLHRLAILAGVAFVVRLVHPRRQPEGHVRQPVQRPHRDIDLEVRTELERRRARRGSRPDAGRAGRHRRCGAGCRGGRGRLRALRPDDRSRRRVGHHAVAHRRSACRGTPTTRSPASSSRRSRPERHGRGRDRQGHRRASRLRGRRPDHHRVQQRPARLHDRRPDRARRLRRLRRRHHVGVRHRHRRGRARRRGHLRHDRHEDRRRTPTSTRSRQRSPRCCPSASRWSPVEQLADETEGCGQRDHRPVRHRAAGVRLRHRVRRRVHHQQRLRHHHRPAAARARAAPCHRREPEAGATARGDGGDRGRHRRDDHRHLRWLPRREGHHRRLQRRRWRLPADTAPAEAADGRGGRDRRRRHHLAVGAGPGHPSRTHPAGGGDATRRSASRPSAAAAVSSSAPLSP